MTWIVLALIVVAIVCLSMLVLGLALRMDRWEQILDDEDIEDHGRPLSSGVTRLDDHPAYKWSDTGD